MLEGVFLGVGQIYTCEALGPSLLILGAVLLYSPLQALHAVMGSAAGALAGQSPPSTLSVFSSGGRLVLATE